jgi:hypothetical protein
MSDMSDMSEAAEMPKNPAEKKNRGTTGAREAGGGKSRPFCMCTWCSRYVHQNGAGEKEKESAISKFAPKKAEKKRVP